MAWEFDSARPIYLQLIDIIKFKIASGALKFGDKLPSVRDMSIDYGVNPNTMQRAFSELERDGLLFSIRTQGRYVTEDGKMIKQMSGELAVEQIKKIVGSLLELGYSKEELMAMIENYLRGME